jgi:type IV fimbrial biogenesis protein FimT
MTPNPVAQLGFSLSETLLTVGILLILLAMAMPGFRSMQADTRLATAVDTFANHLRLARTEAIQRGDWVVLCASADGRSCLDRDQGAWHQGWLVFHDANRSRQLDAGEGLIHAHDALEGTEIVTNLPGGTRVAFGADGGTAGTFGSFGFCDTARTGEARGLVLALSGRIRTDEQSNLCTGPGS